MPQNREALKPWTWFDFMLLAMALGGLAGLVYALVETAALK
jgi:hypothetical protein